MSGGHGFESGSSSIDHLWHIACLAIKTEGDEYLDLMGKEIMGIS